MKKLLFCLVFPILSTAVWSQQPLIDVAELTLKISALSTEELFYGFAEGDQIVFNFQELKGKELKEIEIVELPNHSKFMDFKSKIIQDKTINLNQKGVYKFRFYNSAMSGRVCKVKIQRRPKSAELANFNTNWEWKTLYDTSYVPYTEDSLVGYDTLYYKETVRELIKTDQKEELIFDKTIRVHSQTNEHGNKTHVFFTLPQNTKSDYREQKVISWAYWVGVGEEAGEAWKQNVSAISVVANEAANVYLTPLGALAVGAITELIVPKMGEDVAYQIMDRENTELFLAGMQYRIYDQGKGVAGFRKFTNKGMLQGTWYIGLLNDNIMQGIDANVKVIAIIESNTYADVEHDRQKVDPRYVKLNKQRMVVNTSQVRVNAE